MLLHGAAVSVADLAYRRAVRPAIFGTGDGDAEAAHERAIRILARFGTVPPARAGARLIFGARRRRVQVAGIDFPGIVGLAAGMDKNGIAARAWDGLGFGFAELGTVTPRPQPGNPKPRLFRLPHSRAVINRMGFNNAGAQALAQTLDGFGVRRGNRAAGIPLGISIGKNKATPIEAAAEDYLSCYRRLCRYADYLAVNVSSPNTPGLRALQDADALTELITALTAAAHDDAVDGQPALPIMVKIAPDLDETALEEVLQVAENAGAAGLIATNTTLDRDGIGYQDLALAPEAGGLSGAPVNRRARQVVGFLADRTSLPVIGVGGIGSAADAEAMVDAGASLLQLLTGFIYDGPGLLTRINTALSSSGRAIGAQEAK